MTSDRKTRWTDEDLRQAMSDRHGEGPGEHLETERLWALAAGDLPTVEARAAVDHLSLCPACAEDFRITREMVAASAPDKPKASARETPAEVIAFPGKGRTRRAVLAVAAGLLLAVGLAYRFGPGDESSVYRLPSDPTVIASESPGVLDRTDVRLAWTDVEGARYHVLITTPELETVAEAGSLEEPSWKVPPPLLDRAPSRLLWQVEATLPDGRRVNSPPFDLVLRDGSDEKN